MRRFLFVPVFCCGVLLAADVRLLTPLTGGSVAGITPSGHADFRLKNNTGDLRLNVEIEGVSLPAGTQLAVQANGITVGKITVSGAPFRGGELELNTQDGQQAPLLKAGDTITVRGTAGVLLSGVVQSRVFETSSPATTPSPAVTSVDGLLRSGLAGGPLAGVSPSGQAEFRDRGGNRNRLHVEVEDVNLPAGTQLQIEIGGRIVGRITLGAQRGGELEIDTLAGDFVAGAQAGDAVRILGPNGPVLSGALQVRSFSVKQSGADDSAKSSASTASDDTKVRTGLAGGTINGVSPSGHVEFRVKSTQAASSLNIEIEDVNLPQGTKVDVVVGGKVIGQITIGPPPMRGGELELNSRDGDVVPQVKAGDLVSIRTAAQGTILTGVVQVQSFTSVPALPSSGKGTDDKGGDDRGGSSGNTGNSGNGNSGSGSGNAGSGGNSGSGNSGSGNSGSGGSGSGNSGSGNAGDDKGGNSGSGSGQGGSGK